MVEWRELIPKYSEKRNAICSGVFYFISDKFTFRENIVDDLEAHLNEMSKNMGIPIEKWEINDGETPEESLFRLPWDAENGEDNRSRFANYFSKRILYIPNTDELIDDKRCVKYLDDLSRLLEREEHPGILCMAGTKSWTDGVGVTDGSIPSLDIEDLRNDRLNQTQLRNILEDTEHRQHTVTIDKLCKGIPVLIHHYLNSVDKDAYFSTILELGLIPKPNEAIDDHRMRAISHLRWRVFHPPKKKGRGLDHRLLSTIYQLSQEQEESKSKTLLDTIGRWINPEENDAVSLDQVERLLKLILESEGIETGGEQFRFALLECWENGWFPWGYFVENSQNLPKRLRDGMFLFSSLEMARNRSTHDSRTSFISKIWFTHYDMQDAVGTMIISLILCCIVRDKKIEYEQPLLISKYDLEELCGDSIHFQFFEGTEKKDGKKGVLNWDPRDCDFK